MNIEKEGSSSKSFQRLRFRYVSERLVQSRKRTKYLGKAFFEKSEFIDNTALTLVNPDRSLNVPLGRFAWFVVYAYWARVSKQLFRMSLHKTVNLSRDYYHLQTRRFPFALPLEKFSEPFDPGSANAPYDSFKTLGPLESLQDLDSLIDLVNKELKASKDPRKNSK